MILLLLDSIVFALMIGLFIRWYFGTKKLFKESIKHELREIPAKKADLINEGDLELLPELIKNYLHNAKVVGTPRVKFFQVTMTGNMRIERDIAFAPVKATQYTFVTSGTRLFYMTMNFKGLPISGLHHYNALGAFMRIKILDLFKVADHSGDQMQLTETVTYFNDLCIMAPGALLEEDIEWAVLDRHRVKGTLRKHGHAVSAELSFNDEGMLENFISEDRLSVNADGNYDSMPWSTPMCGYGEVGQFYLPNKGEAIWHYPDDEFSYIRLDIEQVTINE